MRVIAQDVNANAPANFENLISTTYDANDNPLLYINYPKLVPVLWAIIQDLKAKKTRIVFKHV